MALQTSSSQQKAVKQSSDAVSVYILSSLVLAVFFVQVNVFSTSIYHPLFRRKVVIGKFGWFEVFPLHLS